MRKARFDPKYTSRILRGRFLPAKDRRRTKILRYRDKVFPTDQNFAFEVREASGFQECERYCTAKRLCVAFSYFRRSSQCHFYEHVGAYVTSAGVDSGIKRVQP